jgi:hypothetical protein
MHKLTPLQLAENASTMVEDNVLHQEVGLLSMILDPAVKQVTSLYSATSLMVKKLLTIVLTKLWLQINFFKTGHAHRIQRNVQLRKMS